MKTLRFLSFFFPFLALLCSMNAFAGEWIADVNKGCQVWNPNPAPGESISWSGPCSNNKATGQGILQWYLDGKPNGRYEGEFLDGMSHGKGIDIDGKGNRYAGDFERNKYHGKGVFTFAQGDPRQSTEGDFRDSHVDGVAVAIWANGDRYQGEFRKSLQYGKGVLTRPDGYRYEGDWVDGKMTGEGVMKLTNGDRYAGSFVDNKRNGKGVDTYSGGARYDGDHKDDQRHGKGSYVRPDGSRDEGDWVADKLHGNGVRIFANGNRYEGGFVAGEVTGKGISTEKEGYRYEGQWLNGKRQGYGVQTYADGDRYEGNWDSGKKTGLTVFEQRGAERRAAGGGDDSGGKLFASLLGAVIVGSAPSNMLSSTEKVRMATGLISDIQNDGKGQGINAATQAIQSGRAAPTKPNPNTNSVPAAPTTLAQVTPTLAKTDESWRACGPGKTCAAGDGYAHFCSGPAKPGAPMCKSECRMTSGVAYHDTSLPNNAAYIPSSAACVPGCTAVNSC
jgi:hypothetical protein